MFRRWRTLKSDSRSSLAKKTSHKKRLFWKVRQSSFYRWNSEIDERPSRSIIQIARVPKSARDHGLFGVALPSTEQYTTDTVPQCPKTGSR
ncbi:hypothetical protein T265_04229 [Opisthorchis viverrini]|uniref:Uncharacterized protein n=1 Tax=Opisthorchis viverrini TaxID=6198 RepID=A0A075A0F6_OPIVI|nr:hypothetical protein T265_04229 [Opisthorchis viverrini]KER29040.1 hypothetical protein T265_04229 [Opisthorchis viverrini]